VRIRLWTETACLFQINIGMAIIFGAATSVFFVVAEVLDHGGRPLPWPTFPTQSGGLRRQPVQRQHAQLQALPLLPPQQLHVVLLGVHRRSCRLL